MSANAAPAAVPEPNDPAGTTPSTSPAPGLIASMLTPVEPARTAFSLQPQMAENGTTGDTADTPVTGVSSAAFHGDGAAQQDATGTGSGNGSGKQKPGIWRAWLLAGAARWGRGGGALNKRLDMQKARAAAHQVKETRQVSVNRSGGFGSGGGRSSGTSATGPGGKSLDSKGSQGGSGKGPKNTPGGTKGGGTGPGGGTAPGTKADRTSPSKTPTGDTGRTPKPQKPPKDNGKGGTGKGGANGNSTGGANGTSANGASGKSGSQGPAGSPGKSGSGSTSNGKAPKSDAPSSSRTSKDSKPKESGGKQADGTPGNRPAPKAGTGAAEQGGKDSAPKSGKDTKKTPAKTDESKPGTAQDTKSGNDTKAGAGTDPTKTGTTQPANERELFSVQPSRETGYRDGTRAAQAAAHVKAYRDGVKDGWTDTAEAAEREKARLDQAHADRKNARKDQNMTYGKPVEYDSGGFHPISADGSNGTRIYIDGSSTGTSVPHHDPTPIPVKDVTGTHVFLGDGANRASMTRGEVRSVKDFERRLEERAAGLDKAVEQTRNLKAHADTQARQATRLLEAARGAKGGEKYVGRLTRLQEAAQAQAAKADEIQKRALRAAEKCRAVLSNIQARYGGIYKAVVDSPETAPAELAFYKG
ncbi:hypothetical protein OG571_47240 (plasmid) [Streptomyces sp. NBC_01369]|uniref:hypothetical protein n=1 Tax=Streptomyces sp. NBC_01369 TaxID=2903842 RepID=UPI002F90A69C